MIQIPVDLPADFSHTINFSSIEAKMPDLSPVITIIQETWDHETLAGLEQGKVAVPDAVINQSLTAALGDDTRVKELQISSLGDGKIKIAAVVPQAGHIVLVCKLEQFQHDKQRSVMTMKILNKKLPDKPMLSWIFSKVSLAMAAKFVGKVDFGPDLLVDIKGNTVTIDFHQALYNSRFGSAELFGFKLLDALVITQAVPQQGYVEFDTALDMPDSIKSMLQNILH